MNFQAERQAKTRFMGFMRTVWVLALAVGLLPLAGCGSSSSTSSSASSPATAATTPTATTPKATTPTASTPKATTPKASTPAPATGDKSGGQKLSLAADPGGQLKYDKSSLTAKAGKVSIDFTNTAPVEHDVAIASSSGAVAGATPVLKGGSSTLSLNLKSGTYKFYCTVPGHRAAGMEGTLTVQ